MGWVEMKVLGASWELPLITTQGPSCSLSGFFSVGWGEQEQCPVLRMAVSEASGHGRVRRGQTLLEPSETASSD